MKLKEEINGPKAFREEDCDGILSLIDSREKELGKIRDELRKGKEYSQS